MVEWTNTGPYSYFMESIPLEISPHVPKPVIHLWTISHPFVVEFQMLTRSSLRAVGCGLIVRPWALGFVGHVPVLITFGRPFFSERCTPRSRLAALLPRRHSSCRIPNRCHIRLVVLRKDPVYCSIRVCV